MKWERKGYEKRQTRQNKTRQGNRIEQKIVRIPVVEEDIWDPYQVGRKAQVLNPGVVLWVP